MQGACCGPLAATNGGKPGQVSNQCGTYMYDEVLAALGGPGSTTFYDNETQSDIAYFTGVGADGYTTPGTWVSYNGERSVKAIAAYAKALGLGGAFVFEPSMDTVDSSGSTWSYTLMNAIADTLTA